MEYIYEIKDLNCSYNGERVVLNVERLNIPKGKVTMFLGASGSGKSTILETLGLMNNTMLDNSTIQLNTDVEKINFRELYNLNGDEEIASVRNKYFSFIFQETNLMRNFTVYENACLTLMMQGFSRPEADLKVAAMLEKMDLGKITKSTKPFDISGGQKQRVAFVRAIVPNFKVLFGDEPTGNLDINNAKKLMTILFEELKEKDASAIIVTHDLKLALNFADCLVVLEKRKIVDSDNPDEPGERGFIFEDNVFNRVDKGWKSAKNIEYKTDRLAERIQEIMINESFYE